MKQWKKVMSAAVVTTMAVGMLAGCGGSDKGAGNSEGGGDVIKIGSIGPAVLMVRR